jgi:hypothetical protein
VNRREAGASRLRDDFDGRVPSCSRGAVPKVGANYEVAVKAGDVIEATTAGAATSSGPEPRR